MNKRVEKISPFIVMDIVKEAKRLKDVIHFEVGQPDLPPSENVKKGLIKVTDELLFPYTESKGESLLREKISEFYKIMYGIAISPHRILITPGTSGAFLIAYALTVDTEEVIAFTLLTLFSVSTLIS